MKHCCAMYTFFDYSCQHSCKEPGFQTSGPFGYRMTDCFSSRKPTERFTGRVEVYRRYRSRFPREIIPLLQKRCGLTPASVIADIGAGTGMLAELFLENGNTVFAVEPNAEMRAACSELISSYPRLTCVGATAEATGLPDRTFDFITAGRAFHWFDRAKCRPEFQRILRRDGWVLLASADSLKGKEKETILQDYELLLREHGLDYAAIRNQYNVDDAVNEFFSGSEIYKEVFRTVEELTYEEFEGRTLSLSVTPQPDHPRFPAFRSALQIYFDRYQSHGKIRWPLDCAVCFGHLH